jgi:hypothetical protein
MNRTFSWLIWRMSARISAAMAGRPGRFRPHHHPRWCCHPCRRQRRTVSGCTIVRASCQRDHAVDNRTHTHRSTGEHWCRMADRAKTASGWRRDMVSSARCTRSHSANAIVWQSHRTHMFMTCQHAHGSRKNQAISGQTNYLVRTASLPYGRSRIPASSVRPRAVRQVPAAWASRRSSTKGGVSPDACASDG